MKTLSRFLLFAVLTFLVGTAVYGQDQTITNLSVRSKIGKGDATFNAGFILTEESNMLIRAIGPTLSSFGVATPCSDPKLTLYKLCTDGSGAASQLIAYNDNWGGDASLRTSFARVGAFALPSNSKDAAVAIVLQPGNYTAVITCDEDENIGLLELYTLGGRGPTNISARAWVSSGDGALIAGLTISGLGKSNMLLRAVGPSLKQFGIEDYLSDPKMTIWQGSVAIKEVDHWVGGPGSEIYFKRVGAFPLLIGENDSAFFMGFSSQGSGAKAYEAPFSVVAASKDGTSGTAIVEVYLMP